MCSEPRILAPARPGVGSTLDGGGARAWRACVYLAPDSPLLLLHGGAGRRRCAPGGGGSHAVGSAVRPAAHVARPVAGLELMTATETTNDGSERGVDETENSKQIRFTPSSPKTRSNSSDPVPRVPSSHVALQVLASAPTAPPRSAPATQTEARRNRSGRPRAGWLAARSGRRSAECPAAASSVFIVCILRHSAPSHRATEPRQGGRGARAGGALGATRR